MRSCNGEMRLRGRWRLSGKEAGGRLARMDAFETLGLERRLVLPEERRKEAFRARSRVLHPDAGGSAEGFEALEAADGLLADAARRLRHWLELQGVEGDLRGAVSSGLMDLFGELGPELQGADGLLREREQASSALGRAMLEGRSQQQRERLERLQEKVAAAEESVIERFPAIEAGQADGWSAARELAFLAKWRRELRERYAALW